MLGMQDNSDYCKYHIMQHIILLWMFLPDKMKTCLLYCKSYVGMGRRQTFNLMLITGSTILISDTFNEKFIMLYNNIVKVFVYDVST